MSCPGALLSQREIELDERVRSRERTVKELEDHLRESLSMLSKRDGNGQGCMTRVGDELPGDLIVYDDGHLTTAGTRFLMATGLGQRIESLLPMRQSQK